MSELVEKLSQGRHPVEISLRPDRTVAALKRCIDQGYTHIKFTETRGGTDLYVPLDSAASDLSAADFDKSTGTVKLVGKLTLDYVPVRCLAEIDLATLAGTGNLEPIADAA
jgi:hypothetical protein